MFHSGSISLARVSVAPSRAGYIDGGNQGMESRCGARTALTVFRCRVPSGGWFRDEANGGGIVEQIPSLRLIHLSKELEGLLRDVHRTPEINFEHRPCVRFSNSLDFADDRIPSVVEHVINSTEFFFYFLEGRGDLFGFGYVEFDDEQV